MITADELQHLGASGHATGQTQGGHGQPPCPSSPCAPYPCRGTRPRPCGQARPRRDRERRSWCPFRRLRRPPWSPRDGNAEQHRPHDSTKSIISWPSTVITWLPLAEAMNSGSAPTPRQARTGLLTPPGISSQASLNNFSERVVFIISSERWVERQAPLSSHQKRGRRPCRANRLKKYVMDVFFNSSRLSSTAYSSSAVSRRNSSMT